MMASMEKTTLILYGIPNCDTVKKARTWLGTLGLEYQFHDFKKQGVPEKQLDFWIKTLGWEPLVNTRGTTWRKLDEATRAGVTGAASARALMLAQPSVIKRPVVHWVDASLTVGFDEATWRAKLG